MRPRTIRALRPAVAGALLAGGVGTGCAGGAPPGPVAPPTPAPEECVLPGGDRGAPAAVLVAAGAPDDSLFLAHQRLDTPVRLDCNGQPRPGLAVAWSPGAGGRAWTLTLDSARAPGGAAALAAAWKRSPGAAAALWGSSVESVIPLDAHRLMVTFRAPYDSLPGVLADPALGVPRDSLAGRGLVPAGSDDARDALDRGAAVVRTTDRLAIEYASSRDDLTTSALPWHRTYVLILPAGAGPVPPAVSDTTGFRDALARDAVQIDSRGAEPPFWWDSPDCRPPGVAPTPKPRRSNGILYSSDDEVARGLAERLAATWEAERVVVRGVAPREFAVALEAGADRGYVVALPHRALVPCREIAGWPRGAAVVALIDIRAHAIVRAGGPALEVDYDGTLHRAGPR